MKERRTLTMASRMSNQIGDLQKAITEGLARMSLQECVDRDALGRTNLQLMRIQRKALEAAEAGITVAEANTRRDDLVRMCLKSMTHGIPYRELEAMLEEQETGKS